MEIIMSVLEDLAKIGLTILSEVIESYTQNNNFFEETDSCNDYDNERSWWFDPWIGSSYWNGGYKGRKILVIGNNHYCDSRLQCSCCGVGGSKSSDWNCDSMTQNVIQEYIDFQNDNGCYDSWMSTFEKFENAVEDGCDSDDFWNSIAFYNFLQTAVRKNEDKCNSDKIYRQYISEYNNSNKCLWNVISDLNPDYIIVWGSCLRKHFHGTEGCTGGVIQKRTGIPTLYIHHPSQGFSSYYWNEIIWNFLNNN